MSYSDNDEMTQMVDALGKGVVKMLAEMGPVMGDLIRATTNATVDTLIENRERMLAHHWPEELADLTIITIINRNADVAKKVAEAVQASQNRKST